MDRELAASNRGKPRWDSLEVSLHDVDLAQEVELLTHLMVAANETEHRLHQSDVDQILGVTGNGARDGAREAARGGDVAALDGGPVHRDGAASGDDDRTPGGVAPVVPAQRSSAD